MKVKIQARNKEDIPRLKSMIKTFLQSLGITNVVVIDASKK